MSARPWQEVPHPDTPGAWAVQHESRQYALLPERFRSGRHDLRRWLHRAQAWAFAEKLNAEEREAAEEARKSLGL